MTQPMMQSYTTRVYLVGHVTYTGVEAASMEDAIRKVDAENNYAHDIQYADYSEQIDGYLVDNENEDSAKSGDFDGEGKER